MEVRVRLRSSVFSELRNTHFCSVQGIHLKLYRVRIVWKILIPNTSRRPRNHCWKLKPEIAFLSGVGIDTPAFFFLKVLQEIKLKMGQRCSLFCRRSGIKIQSIWRSIFWTTKTLIFKFYMVRRGFFFFRTQSIL